METYIQYLRTEEGANLLISGTRQRGRIPAPGGRPGFGQGALISPSGHEMVRLILPCRAAMRSALVPAPLRYQEAIGSESLLGNELGATYHSRRA